MFCQGLSKASRDRGCKGGASRIVQGTDQSWEDTRAHRAHVPALAPAPAMLAPPPLTG